MKTHTPTKLRQLAIAIASALSFGVGQQEALAVTKTVKNLNDSGTNSLRAAITAINASSDASNTINFQAGLDGIIKLNSALPQISASVSINGPSAEKLKISGGNGGVLNILAGIVDISGLTLESKGRDGGAVIRNQFGLLTINECVITGKRPGNQTGFVNELSGQAIVTSSAILSNDTRGFGTNGGGIRNEGTLTLINSTIAKNTARRGGGIYNTADGTISLINSTVADNKSFEGGSGIYNLNTATLGNTIVARNGKQSSSHDDDDDDCDDDRDEVVSISNDVFGTFISNGKNLIGTTANSTGFGVADLLNIATSLLRFAANVADNGGATPTLALLTGSRAINAGSNTIAVDENGSPLAFDQRGAPFNRINGGTIDIGAFETASPAPLANARAYKQRALKTVSDALCDIDNLSRADQYYLKQGSSRIAASLESWLWRGGNELSRYGFFAFEREKQAVWYLSKVANSAAAATAAKSAIADLVEADKIIALTALNAAAGTPCDNLNQALAKFNLGIGSTDAYAAIEYFRWSWWFSQLTLDYHCDYDDDDEDYEYRHCDWN